MTFKPIGKHKRDVFPLHLPKELSKRLKKATENSGLARQDLVRQMIEFCLNNIKFEPKIPLEEGEQREEF